MAEFTTVTCDQSTDKNNGKKAKYSGMNEDDQFTVNAYSKLINRFAE